MPDCIFCNIAKGFAPAQVRHESDEFLAFDDQFPKAATHVLIVPRAHCEHLDAWIDSGGDTDRMLTFVAEVVDRAGIAGGYRLLTNVGRDGGQMIGHLHWHVMAGGVAVF